MFQMLFSIVGIAFAITLCDSLKLEILPNGVSKNGDEVTINCLAENEEIKNMVLMKLYHTPAQDIKGTTNINSTVFAFSSSGEKDVVARLKDHSSLMQSNGSYSISFNASYEDEGDYHCEGIALMKNYVSPYLSFILIQPAMTPVISLHSDRTGGEPTRNEVGDFIKVNCTANVGKPAGKLKLIGKDNKEVTKKSNSIVWVVPSKPGSDSGSTIYKSIEYNERISLDHHGVVYSCILEPNVTNESNATLKVSSKALIVDFPVKDIEIKPFHDKYHHGDIITCTAKGRPEPTINWAQLSGKSTLTINGSQVIVTEGANIGYYAFTCSASNTLHKINNNIQQSIGFNLVNPEEKPTVGVKVKHWVNDHHKGITIAMITIGVLCGFALLAIISAYLYNSANSGTSTSYNRLTADKAKLYGASNGEISSDEEESYEPLNKNSSEGHWLGTQV